MNQPDHSVAPGHAQEAGPIKDLACRGANGLDPAIGGRPHRAGGGQPEFRRNGHQLATARAVDTKHNLADTVRLLMHEIGPTQRGCETAYRPRPSPQCCWPANQ